jgi:hypothetical protein
MASLNPTQPSVSPQSPRARNSSPAPARIFPEADRAPRKALECQIDADPVRVFAEQRSHPVEIRGVSRGLDAQAHRPGCRRAEGPARADRPGRYSNSARSIASPILV